MGQLRTLFGHCGHTIGADGHPVMLTAEADLDDVLVLVSPSGDSCSGHGHMTLHNSTRTSHGFRYDMTS